MAYVQVCLRKEHAFWERHMYTCLYFSNDKQIIKPYKKIDSQRNLSYWEDMFVLLFKNKQTYMSHQKAICLIVSYPSS